MTIPTHIIGPGGAGPDERLQLADHIIGAIDKGIAVLAPDSRVRWANDAFGQWCLGSPVGKHFLDALQFTSENHVTHEAFQAAHAGASACFRLAHDKLILDVTLSPVRDGDQVTELVAFCDNVTAAVTRQQKLVALYNASQELATLDPDALMTMNFDCRVGLLKQNIHKYIHDLLHYDVIEIRLYNPATEALEPLMAEGMLPEAATRELYARPEENGVTGYVAATRTAYLCNDASQDPRFLQGSPGAKSSMTVPILYHDELIGTFNVESPRTEAFGEEDLQFTELFARELGRALHTLKLLDQQERSTARTFFQDLSRETALPLDNLIALASTLLVDGHTAPANQTQHLLDDIRSLKAVFAKLKDRFVCDEVAETAETPNLLAGQRVLVLDSEERVRRSAHSLLERKGCIVETTGVAKEAIAMAQAGQYHTIMMAVRLKEARGTETFLALAKVAPAARMILLRGFGHDSAHTEVNIRLAGFHPSVLFKPFQEEFLCKALTASVPPSNF